ncbi:hypothetical protein, partial [Cryobacterium sp.]|uniref:hypothetical protein n=1 Tax=Cryobacterium sp. TaxID=1926290 RepID=UPI0026043196
VDASRLAALAAVLVTTLALAAVAGVLFQRSRDAAAVEDYYRPTSAPLEAARTAAKVLFSYDHRNLDRDFAAGAALSTGVFRAEYARTTARVVREVATQYRAVVVAEPVVAGVQAAEPGEVVAVLFVNQSTQSTRVEGTKVDQSRVRMTLVERGDTWLVSKVEAL